MLPLPAAAGDSGRREHAMVSSERGLPNPGQRGDGLEGTLKKRILAILNGEDADAKGASPVEEATRSIHRFNAGVVRLDFSESPDYRGGAAYGELVSLLHMPLRARELDDALAELVESGAVERYSVGGRPRSHMVYRPTAASAVTVACAEPPKTLHEFLSEAHRVGGARVNRFDSALGEARRAIGDLMDSGIISSLDDLPRSVRKIYDACTPDVRKVPFNTWSKYFREALRRLGVLARTSPRGSAGD